MAEIAIGIDLGTSNSCVARAEDGTVDVLANAYGEKITASVVAFPANIRPIAAPAKATARITANSRRERVLMLVYRRSRPPILRANPWKGLLPTNRTSLSC